MSRGHDVVVVDNLTGGWRDNVPEGASFAHADLATANLDVLFKVWKPTHVWHLAAYAAEGLSHWVREFNYTNNVIGSVRLLNASIKSGLERFTFTSSMAVYGAQKPPFTELMRPTPEDPYGIAKYTVEQDLAASGQLFDLPYVIFRPHNVYGPGQNIGDPYRNVVGIFMRKGLGGEPLTVYGDGTQTRAFSYITDIVDPMLRSLDVDITGQTVNIGGEQVITIGELADQVALRFGVEVKHSDPRVEVKHAFCNHAKARDLLGFNPQVSLEVGLDRMEDWVRAAGVRWSKTPALELTEGLPSFWRSGETAAHVDCQCSRMGPVGVAPVCCV
jgi:UDP-glucose 4-epimerase